MLNGLNKPVVFKLFSTTLVISDPKFSILVSSKNIFFELSSMYKGDTATGSGFKFPLVISTSIKEIALNGIKVRIITLNIYSFFFILSF